MRHDVEVTYNESCSKNNTLNCWNALKFIKLQRSNEIKASIEAITEISEMTSASSEEISASTMELSNSSRDLADSAENLAEQSRTIIEELNKFKL